MDKVPREARVETSQFNVTFHYEMVEQVSVEAEDKHEAKRLAEEKQTYDGEIMETLHTSKRQWGEMSPASIEYLEQFNLLPEDHDLTQEDLEKVIDLE